ncbi:MAG: endonuclease/exonuclease/phosphatase family protein [Mycobacteriales bacterium]
MTVLRMLSYNVRSLRGDANAVARVMASVRPHVVCVQEAPRFLRWRTRSAALARKAGLVVLGGGRPGAGNLLLCDIAIEVESTADLRLSHRWGMHRRGAAVAVCSLAGSRFALAGTHLDLAAADRQRHVRELFDRLPAAGGGADVPLILAGDVNDVPSSATWRLIADRLAEAHTDDLTFPADQPVRRIDGVFVDRRCGIGVVRVLDSPDVRVGSDHRPVYAEIELPAAAPPGPTRQHTAGSTAGDRPLAE